MSLPANILNLANSIQEAQQAIRAGTETGGSYLRLPKDGVWVYGADSIEVEEGSFWALAPNSLQFGFCAWDDGVCVGEEMSHVGEPAIPKSKLPDVGAEWKEQTGVNMVCISGADKGTQVTYKVSSLSGRKALSALFDTIVKRAQKGKTDVTPVIELLVDSYKHKKYGKIYTPILDVKEWREMDDDTDVEEVKEEAPEPEKVKRVAKKAAPEPKVIEAELDEDDNDDEEVEVVTPVRVRRARS